MKFELKPNNTNASDGELLDDLKKVAERLKKDSIGSREYVKNGGRFHSTTISSRFNGWNNALERAGLIVTNFANISDDELLEDLKKIAKSLNKKTIASREYVKEGGKFHSTTISSRFNGWNNALERAGLSVINFANISDNNLFENIEEVWVKIGRQPSFRDMKRPLSKYTAAPYAGRFGSWRKALEAFVKYINTHIDDSKEIDEVEPITPTPIQEKETIPNHKTNRGVNWRLRFLVMRRDNFKCVACGRTPATDPSIILHVDHIQAWDKGGETLFENLQTLCSICNIGKSNLDFKEIQNNS